MVSIMDSTVVLDIIALDLATAAGVTVGDIMVVDGLIIVLSGEDLVTVTDMDMHGILSAMGMVVLMDTTTI